MIGRTIEIYLPNANPRGVRECTIMDSITKAIVVPRPKLGDVTKRDDLQDPGVYFLVGESDDLGKPEIYIGEAEQLIKRLKQHNSSKEFWQTAICFVSVKHNLNKAHIKFLENHCCEIAKETNRCSLHNSNTPTKSSLTNKDRDFVLRFFEELKIIIGTLGFPIFESIRKEKKNMIYCKGKDADAQGTYSEDGLLVFKGSKANLEESESAGPWVLNMRSKLKEQKILFEREGVLVFSSDHLFNSPSAAAAVILARRANGWTEWKTKDKKTIDEVIRKKAK
ncbi:GIY-YIG nuclease family protein [Candidatus Woesearchaeota archaeon]|nr:GIY-YIG nuclease family protein [Candidatus Woesearchaeota archaeon]